MLVGAVNVTRATPSLPVNAEGALSEPAVVLNETGAPTTARPKASVTVALTAMPALPCVGVLLPSCTDTLETVVALVVTAMFCVPDALPALAVIVSVTLLLLPAV